jgi:hypothetical protein
MVRQGLSASVCNHPGKPEAADTTAQGERRGPIDINNVSRETFDLGFLLLST